MRWEHFEHGADVGVRGIGPTPASAFEQAALALTAVITEPDAVSEFAKRRQRDEMGTLGSGNHYLEVQEVSDIFKPAVAASFGLRAGYPRKSRSLLLRHERQGRRVDAVAKPRRPRAIAEYMPEMRIAPAAADLRACDERTSRPS